MRYLGRKSTDCLRPALLLGALMSLCLTSVGCLRGRSGLSDSSFRVFSGFTFVASGPYRPEREAIPRHDNRELPLPERPSVGVQYVFHSRDVVDDEKLALVEFPARLRAAGIKIVRAPQSDRDLMYLFMGGPLFKIWIKEGNHEGMIYNQLGRELKQGPDDKGQLPREDYVLVWLK